MQSDYERCKPALDALEDAFRAVFAQAHEGMTADEIDQIIISRAQRHGAEFKPSKLSPYVVDETGAPPKLRLDRLPLRKGALWGIDCTLSCQGYFADVGRYGYIGAPSEAVKANYQQVLDRQDLLAGLVRPGMSVEELWSLCPKDLPFEVHRIGTGASLRPLCGNSVQGALREMQVSIDEGLVYEPGMVICVEVWAGLLGGIEDMYQFTGEGLSRITTLPRGLGLKAEAGK